MRRTRTDRGGQRGGHGGQCECTRSEGQRLLLEVPASLSELARLTGCTKQAASQWRNGLKQPSSEVREVLEKTHGVPAWSWDYRPHMRPSGGTSARPALPEKASTLERVLALVEDTRRELEDPGLIASVRVALRASHLRALTLCGRLETELVLEDPDAVLHHPTWRRMRSVMLQALSAYPDAYAAVLAALEAFDDASTTTGARSAERGRHP